MKNDIVKKERGQVIILVLILLAMSSLAIGTTLSYANSGLRSCQVAEDVMMEQYAADAAMEDAVWRLKNNIEFPDNPGINRESLIPGGTTSVTSPITVNDMDVSVMVELPDSLPDTYITQWFFLDFELERNPRWIKTGDVISYAFTITNKFRWFNRYIYQVGASLSPGLEYVYGSSDGITTNDPAITIENDQQKLTWDLDPPHTLDPRQSATQFFNATASVDGGIYYTTAGGNLWSGIFDWETFDTGPDAPVWTSTYYITITAMRVTLEACAALTQSGGVIDGVTIFNWEEQ